MISILLDTCVVIDAFAMREPFCADAKQIFNLIEMHKIRSCVTTSSITDIHYLLQRALHSEEQTRAFLAILFKYFDISNTTREDCLNALYSPVSDYEDAVLCERAGALKLDYIVTRNTKDFNASIVPAVTPDTFLKTL